METFLVTIKEYALSQLSFPSLQIFVEEIFIHQHYAYRSLSTLQ